MFTFVSAARGLLATAMYHAERNEEILPLVT